MLKVHIDTFITIVKKILIVFHKEPFYPKELLRYLDYNATTMYRVLNILRAYPNVCAYDKLTQKYQLLVTHDENDILKLVLTNISTAHAQHIASFKRIQKIFEHFSYHPFTIQQVETYLNLSYNTVYRILTRFYKKYPHTIVVNKTEQQHVFKFNNAIKEVIY